jgi:hypothetical protein
MDSELFMEWAKQEFLAKRRKCTVLYYDEEDEDYIEDNGKSDSQADYFEDMVMLHPPSHEAFLRIWKRVKQSFRRYWQDKGKQVLYDEEYILFCEGVLYSFLCETPNGQKIRSDSNPNDVSDDSRLLGAVNYTGLYKFLPYLNVELCINEPLGQLGLGQWRGYTLLHYYVLPFMCKRNPFPQSPVQNIMSFLEAGASLHVKDKLGKTPVDMIMENTMRIYAPENDEFFEGKKWRELFHFIVESGFHCI